MLLLLLLLIVLLMVLPQVQRRLNKASSVVYIDEFPFNIVLELSRT